jgi:hypothetical protein
LQNKQSPWIFLLNTTFFLLLIGCAANSPHDKSYISDSISDRTGIGLEPADSADTLNIEQYFNLGDSLTRMNLSLLPFGIILNSGRILLTWGLWKPI